jgi:hypothetical protein
MESKLSWPFICPAATKIGGQGSDDRKRQSLGKGLLAMARLSPFLHRTTEGFVLM